MNSHFYSTLSNIMQSGQIVTIAVGMQPTRVKIEDIIDDAVTIELQDAPQKYKMTMHWTSVQLMHS